MAGASGWGFDFEGAKELNETFTRLAKEAQDPEGYLGAALVERGFAIMADAVRDAPVDTGRLQNAGYVGSPEDTGNGIVVPIGFATEYAMAVHETHPTDDDYLADAIRDHAKDWLKQVARAMEVFAEEGTKIAIRSGDSRIARDKQAAYQQGLSKADD